ncbi:uncharacterized protein LOC131253574 isoform X2 [Magnolia sinica]|uniref:uncharacterized protein LOC131253574 isoform X2 n=1 Tax=Magnolia sinica TaxID=86752 RepID=UPI00265AC1E2|nr:uncharacterized protein LOC131253574 isoform X2 [Magnolia sinica]
MGDLQSWPPQRNGAWIEESTSPLPSSSPSNPNPSSIRGDSWRRAEETAHEIICRIQPTVVSEQRRKAVIDYVQRLIRGCVGSEVFPFGSVPLRTYLPDGDIDLTALSYQTADDDLASDVFSVLEGEEQNTAAEFEVKDVRYIHAEVKLVKCLVQNIVVDISFNQLGGLCTLCFLEQVDRLIGKDHLFKRSIILIKAWCYYESRILGAHHSLISTYALETLVLYIFHIFHSSLHGPLGVLYRFLDYFSKFDWENYCVSLNGPVAVSSLPEVVVETPEINGGDLLLTEEFLRKCLDMFSVPLRGLEKNTHSFPRKHLNIVDPLKENNNLGRSVSKGNFYRIRSAFTYGARKLGQILLLPGESILEEVNKFFMNTLDRHGSGQRPDVQDSPPCSQDNMLSGVSGSGFASLLHNVQKSMEDKMISGSSFIGSRVPIGETADDCNRILYREFDNIRMSGSARINGIGTRLEKQPPCRNEPQTPTGDATDLATAQNSGSRIPNGHCKPSSSSSELCTSPFIGAHHAPHLHFSRPFNWKFGNGTHYHPKLTNSTNGEVVSWPDWDESKRASNSTFQSCSNYENPATARSTDGFPFSTSNACLSEDSNLGNPSLTAGNSSNCLESNGRGISNVGFREEDLKGVSGSPESSNHLSDLSGDYDNHLSSLLYGQQCHSYILCDPVVSVPPPLPSQLHSKPSRKSLHQSARLKPNMLQHMNGNGAGPGQPFPSASGYYLGNLPLTSGAFGVEEMPKPRGTGMYFPITFLHGPSTVVSMTSNQLPGSLNCGITLMN